MRIFIVLIAGLCLPACFSQPRSLAEETVEVLDDFADAARWEQVASEGVQLKLSTAAEEHSDGMHETALRLDYDFVSGAGYAGIRRKLPFEVPANFELEFSIRGDLPRNNLEFKIVDETGQNVWWVNRRVFEFPRDWTRLAARRRHFQFAWGPSSAPMTRASAIEIVVASAEGGRGTLWLDDLTLRPLPETKPYTGTPTLSASSTASADCAPQRALDGQLDSVWRSAADDRQPALTIDFGSQREFGGLVVHWEEAEDAPGYAVEFSDDGNNWSVAREVAVSGSRPQFLTLPDSEARAVRLALSGPVTGSVAIREVEVLPLESSRDPNAFAAAIADRAPRGFYPRPTRGEGIFWTVIGVPADDREALLSEDGAVEVDKQAFSIEPFLFVNKRLLTWADATISQSLAEGSAPVPTVTRDHNGLQLSVTAAADGEGGDSSILLRYEAKNTTPQLVSGSLFLAMRPFQVNPPYQSLNAVGGVARIDHIGFDDSRRNIAVDDRVIALGEQPHALGCATRDDGDITAYLSEGQVPPHATVLDSQHAASGAVEYRFELAAGESRSWVLCVPFSQEEAARQRLVKPLLAAAEPVEYVRARQQAIAGDWVRATSTFNLLVPAEASDLVNTIRSNLAYILINQDKAAIQPGSRSYERSWIRDGSLTSTALLRFGLPEHAREFVNWYAPYQFDSGKVPCVVDGRGPDPVPENDSHGEFIMAVMNVYRFTNDEAFLRAHWPRVEKAVAYIEFQRAERMTKAYSDPHTSATRQEPNKPAVSLHAFHGLMPESISHEGYSAKPMHSYWDDFFTLRGLNDAAEMAHVLGQKSAEERYHALAEDFARTLYASINLAMEIHGIDYIPGCVELGDFDATSTTVSLWPCGELGRLPAPALQRTFDRYWERFVLRRDDPKFEWVDYTPYELRCIGSLVLLGQVERAHEAIEFFMRDRRPTAWNQWPEVICREPRTAKFLGDLPHTWCGSDFLNSVRMMFLFEHERDSQLILLAGLPGSWISAQPVGFKDMPTYGGRISCTIVRPESEGDQLVANLSGDCPLPTGGIRLAVPLGPATRATINGAPADIDESGRVIVKELPATVEINVAQH